MKSKLSSLFSGFKRSEAEPASGLEPIKAPVVKEVEEYYNTHTAEYLSSYGTIIQAARLASDGKFIEQIIDNIGIEDGMHILDAGCGVCGPAVGFAKLKSITIEAVTISEVQVVKARKHVSDNNLDARITVRWGDFTNLDSIYSFDSFDKIYFLETLGYSNDFRKVIAGAVKVLKKGGSIYIKDFFTAPILDSDQKKSQHRIAEQTRAEYLYKVLDIEALITAFRDLGMYIEFIKPFSQNEDYTKAANFELQSTSHNTLTTALTTSFQVFEVLEVKFRKV